MKLEFKMICGVLHVQVRCRLCKGLCWTKATARAKKDDYSIYECNTCTGGSYDGPSTGGGTRVIRKSLQQ